jgi:hypothetical protein
MASHYLNDLQATNNTQILNDSVIPKVILITVKQEQGNKNLPRVCAGAVPSDSDFVAHGSYLKTYHLAGREAAAAAVEA